VLAQEAPELDLVHAPLSAFGSFEPRTLERGAWLPYEVGFWIDPPQPERPDGGSVSAEAVRCRWVEAVRSPWITYGVSVTSKVVPSDEVASQATNRRRPEESSH
jgi:hypothetical protein